MDAQRSSRTAEWFRDRFSSDATKLLLSLLIIISVLPYEAVQDLSWWFLAIFAVELYGRAVVLRDDVKRRRINRIEIAFLVIDLVAVISFLPIETIWGDVRLLRFFRLARMLLLLGYWGPMAHEIWTILAKRERRFQLFFVAAAVGILSFLSAVLLFHFSERGVDFNGDGDARNDTFATMLWWSFRQVEDPGNLLEDPSLTAAFVCSVVLTLSGLVLFTFLVGIANSVVEELVRVARERRLGMRRHSVICNVDDYARVLLEELVAYYTKGLRTPRIITMGAAENRYPYMYSAALRSIRYRPGRPLSRHDLEKVDADRATRVILRGHRDRDESDSEIVSQILSVRQLNARCDIIAELARRDNVHAALEAGGPRTVPIVSNQFTGRYLAKILLFPGVEEVLDELISSVGVEIYTCLYDTGAMRGVRPPASGLPPFDVMLADCYRTQGVILLGYLTDDPSDPSTMGVRLCVRRARESAPAVDEPPPPNELRGLFGLAPNFNRLGNYVEGIRYGASKDRPPPTAPVAPEVGMCPNATELGEILICGFHEGLVDFCVHLFFFVPTLTVYVLVPEQDRIAEVVEAFVERPEDGFSRAVRGQGVHFVAEGPGEVVCTRHGKRGTIRIMAGDWSKEPTMLENTAVDYHLERMDAVVFTYTPSDSDPDASTALGLIKLINLRASRPRSVKPGMRILCEVQSTEKAALLHHRFAGGGDVGRIGCHPVSVVAAETIRDALLAQAVLIPGISPIYRLLLGEGGPEICKLVPLEPVTSHNTVTFTTLLSDLYQRDGIVLLAAELTAEDGTRRLVTCPEPGTDDFRFRASELTGLLAIAWPDTLPRGPSQCAHCPTARAC